ncbi:hypothetical protein ACWEF9_35995, partial [Streptomyces sp. NPDC004980]
MTSRHIRPGVTERRTHSSTGRRGTSITAPAAVARAGGPAARPRTRTWQAQPLEPTQPLRTGTVRADPQPVTNRYFPLLHEVGAEVVQ